MAVKASWPGVSRKVMGGAIDLHLVGADVLGDAAGLPLGHLGVADIVQQGGLAMVHVAHDHHHGRTGTKSSSLSSAVSMSFSSMVTMTSFSTLQPSSMATRAAVS